MTEKSAAEKKATESAAERTAADERARTPQVGDASEEQRKTVAVVNKLLDEHAAVAAGLTEEETKKFRQGDEDVRADGFPLPQPQDVDHKQLREDREEIAKQVKKAKEDALREDEKLRKDNK